MIKLAALAGAAVLALAPVSSANATDYVFTYTGQNGIIGSGKITTLNTVNTLDVNTLNKLGVGVNGYNIVSITGTFSGATINGLVNDPVQPLAITTGPYTYDNVLSPTSAYVFDQYGIAFTAGSNNYNIFNGSADNGPTGLGYGLVSAPVGGNGATSTEQFGNFTISLASAAPEPASWAMMILGMGVIGFLMRATKRRSLDKSGGETNFLTDGVIA